MATVENILLRESERANRVILYREGLFLIAYDWSAYLFIRYIHQYSVRKKHYKVVRRDVCSLGFPQKVFLNVAGAWKDSIRETEEGYEITLAANDVDIEDFSKWEQSIALRPVVEKAAKPAVPSPLPEPGGNGNGSGYAKIIEHIRTFDLVNQTPMHCVAFIADLQKQLKQTAVVSE